MPAASGSEVGSEAQEKTAGSPPRRLPWDLSPAIAAAAVTAVAGLVAAFLLRRADLALVVAPLLLAAALGWDRRPRGTEVAVALRASAEAGDLPASATALATVEAEERTDAVHLRLEPGGRPPLDIVVTPRAATRLRFVVRLAHSGPQRVLGLSARAIGPDAGWLAEPAGPVTAERVVRPRVVPVRSLPLPARLIGLTGQHVSSRPGDGGEFRDIDQFRPGDRLRRIDWKATARRGQRPGELYVRRTTATSDAAVQLVLDSRDDVTGLVTDWPASYPRPAVSSLDLAREAAASLASAYAASADRVGFDDLADARRAIPPRSGARHLQQVLRAVELTTARGSAFERVRPPLLAPGALVYVLSTFLDDQALRLALTWCAAGHRVIAVDVLPAVVPEHLPARERLALRVVHLERALRFDRLAAAGAEVLVWQDAEGHAREARLRMLARPRRAR